MLLIVAVLNGAVAFIDEMLSALVPMTLHADQYMTGAYGGSMGSCICLQHAVLDLLVQLRSDGETDIPVLPGMDLPAGHEHGQPFLAVCHAHPCHQKFVKGLEFPRVMVIIDDSEAKGFMFSYEKLFGVKNKTQTDKKNEIEGKDTSIFRTKRLFYVACSRAEEIATRIISIFP